MSRLSPASVAGAETAAEQVWSAEGKGNTEKLPWLGRFLREMTPHPRRAFCWGKRRFCGKHTEPGQMSPFISHWEFSSAWQREVAARTEVSVWNKLGKELSSWARNSFYVSSERAGGQGSPSTAGGCSGQHRVLGHGGAQPCNTPVGLFLPLIIPVSVLPFIKGVPDCFLQLHTFFFNLTKVRPGYTELQSVWPGKPLGMEDAQPLWALCFNS